MFIELTCKYHDLNEQGVYCSLRQCVQCEYCTGEKQGEFKECEKFKQKQNECEHLINKHH